MSIEDISAKTGISPSYISLMATGKRNISVKNLIKIAAALGTTPGEVISEMPESDIAALWAAIPPDRQELARKVLESFSDPAPLDTSLPRADGGQIAARQRIRRPAVPKK